MRRLKKPPVPIKPASRNISVAADWRIGKMAAECLCPHTFRPFEFCLPAGSTRSPWIRHRLRLERDCDGMRLRHRCAGHGPCLEVSPSLALSI